MDIFNLLETLLKGFGISGDEKCFSAFIEDLLKPYCRETRIDKLGNVFGFIPSEKKGAKKLMIEAHLDRIGLMVKKIDENGFIEFEKIGGIDERILPSSEVEILGRERLFGVIGSKPPHLRVGDNEKIPGIKDMLIDIGMTKEDAEKIIEPGDFIILKSNLVRLLNNRVSGAALDNRAGMAAVFDFLNKIKGKNLPYDLYIVFSVGEETGLIGASTAAYAVKPDIVMSVDVTFGKLHSKDDSDAAFDLGSGGIIFRGPDVCYEGTLNLIKKAKEENIPFDIEVSGASSGTDITVMQNAAGSAKTFLISIPLKYMHQTVETLSLDDISVCSELFYLIASGGVEIA